MITSKIRKRIQDLSGEYYSRIQFTETKAHQLLEYSQGGSLLSFTPHGLSHISAVERNYDWLIPDSDLESFNPSELFCLLCATFFHDALMIPHAIGDESSAREHHTERAHDFLIKNKDFLGLSIHEVDAIAQVIRAHNVYDFSEIPERVVLGNEIVDLRKLGACLSLADISHADSSRAPEIVFRHLELNEDSGFHWRRHLQISGITREEDTILMSALTFSEAGTEAVNDYKGAIEEQLNRVRPYFNTVLRPIRRVMLTDRRLESPLDQTLQFQTNTPAILKLLIEGVYDREDVFIRELVQNSLDSCLLRRAKQQRRNLEYKPRVLLTMFYEAGRFKAFRIDDNGIGMDLNDVQDTVLWIGNSISSRDDVLSLLEQTLGKNLIATFGIGLLSCFKASNNISVRTRKENETPLQFKLTGVSDNVKPEKSPDVSIGTTIIVEMLSDRGEQIDPEEGIEYYFRQVRQVDLRSLTLEYDRELIGSSRDELFKIALTESERISGVSYFSADRSSAFGIEMAGEDFSGAIWFEGNDFKSVVDTEGSVDILNEGIFVVSDPTAEWFPSFVSFCEGVLNFSSKAISLPAGRDRVLKDERFRARTGELSDKSFGLADALIKQTQSPSEARRDFAALILSYVYANANPTSRDRLLKRMDEYRVRIFKRDDRISLRKVKSAGEQQVYVQYNGYWLQDLAEIDGKQLYHSGDDLTELRAAMMAQDNHRVISTVRSDIPKSFLEADLIKAYFMESDIQIVDLTEEDVLEGKYRSKPVPTSVRQAVGTGTKFIEVSGLPNRKAWKVGNELWVNLANPKMRSVYEALQANSLEPEQLKIVSVLFALLTYRFDDAIQRTVNWLTE